MSLTKLVWAILIVTIIFIAVIYVFSQTLVVSGTGN